MIREPNNGQSPIIVVGMHRSGTSMLSRLLRQMGVFMGADCDSEHAESLTFLTINVRLLESVGAAWSNPTPLLQAMDKATFREHLIDRLRRGFKPRHVRRYLGTETPGTRERFPDFWGWKDPRNTLTFPLWLQHFPQARIIHITRNGVDVAESLVRREQTHRLKRRSMVRSKATTILRQLRLKGPEPKPLVDLQEAFDLWTEYLRFASEAFASCVRPSELLQLRYEDLLLEPSIHLKKVARFLGLQLTESDLDGIAASTKSNRRYAFTESPRLTAFFAKNQDHPLMAQFGYDAHALNRASLDPGKKLRVA